MPCRAPAPPEESITIVSVKDDALDTVPGPIMREYEKTRDFSVLTEPNDKLDWGGLASLDVQPTKCVSKPLMARFRTKATSFGITDAGQISVDDATVWSMFAWHVERVIDYYDHDGEVLDVQFAGAEGKDYRVHHSMHEKIAQEFYFEIAQVIAHIGLKGAGTPFSGTGDTWLEARTSRAEARRLALPRALVPMSPNATVENTEQPPTSPSGDRGAN